MFDQLFSQTATLERHRSGPLVEERRAYLAQLAEQGFSIRKLVVRARYLLVVAEYLQLTQRPDDVIGRNEIERNAKAWANRKPRPRTFKDGHESRAAFRSVATGWLQFLGRLQTPEVSTGAEDSLITEFSDYMLRERGLSSVTVRGRCWFLRRFLGRLGNGGSLQEITVSQIDCLLQGMVDEGSYARVTVQLWATHLRAFFRYAEMKGLCQKGLAAAIHGPRIYSQTSVPMGPTWDDVRRLIATTEGDKPADIRARAILLLLAVYGLRAGELTDLQLGDFDWSKELLRVRCSKVRGSRTYPLVRIVGDAVLRYLKEVRPRSVHRQLFLTLNPPARPLRQLYGIVGSRLRPLAPSLPHHGPHSLRHACATHLLSQGLSLKEIGDHLGHQDPDTTRIYAKVDLTGLRQVADFDLGGVL